MISETNLGMILFTFASGTIIFTGILFVLTRLLKFKKAKFVIALFISAVYSLIESISFTFSHFLFQESFERNIFYGIASNIILIFIGVSLIKYFYKEKWNKTIIVTLLWLIIPIIFGLLSAWLFTKAQ